jgi:hypothetical protein
MRIINIKKSGCGIGNVKQYKRVYGNGLTDDIYQMASIPGIKPTEVLRNISVKKSMTPKRYISFE